jgi:hypothetical protein
MERNTKRAELARHLQKKGQITSESFLKSSLLLLANVKATVLAVPLAEGCGIHLDNGILHQSLCPDKLIIG